MPPALRATDKDGRLVVFTFGYGFDDREPDPKRWSQFAGSLVAQVKAAAGQTPTFYWTSTNSFLAGHLFSHHRDHFVPFQFVLDIPQTQYAHGSVTWNFGFDNLGVLRRDGLPRVVRLDPRYVEEMGWLSAVIPPEHAPFLFGGEE